MHIAPQYHKRQSSSDPFAFSTAAGIAATASTVAPDATPTGSGLLFDTGAPTVSVASVTAPLVPGSATIVITTTPTIATTSPSVTSSPSPTPASASQNEISMGTVAGACLGAFFGLGLLLLAVLLWLRRVSTPRRVRTSPSPLANTLNAKGDEDRRRSRHEPWTKLQDFQEKPLGGGVGVTQTPRDILDHEKSFNMFKKSPSMRTTKTSEAHGIEPVPFEQYHPGLAEELAQPPELPYAANSNRAPHISWEVETADDSFLSMKSFRLSSRGAMSPVQDLAIRTPLATVSGSHRWESAEVVLPDDEDGTISNPFADSPTTPENDEWRKSSGNPFFNARDGRSRSSSRVSAVPSTANPFADGNSLMPKLPRSLAPTDSVMSTVSLGTDRAIQSLIAVLDMPRIVDEDEDDTGRPSIRPSTLSRVSSFGGEEEDITTVGTFPLPPHSPS
ncbi:hypothetical protein JAAARDRAFT_35984 [Jaapia argillacea MUCL 33604]|uniref:Uncharacterized protein n=1 Tax=Jaapia argillacea MUCL 33604 TaxID=933084 RepID=A0A067PRF9_9AGAM|nr:hypothetical protein JAAARDRAFT_35984 [Jaapia argillacea MUCL 33604]